ncbi:MAG: hypothetical protein PHP32_03430 [Candidatus Izemoplasmatales bacterium]|nr:hypothetical protein [Candidatus Izemoplasmatales bacterium]
MMKRIGFWMLVMLQAITLLACTEKTTISTGVDQYDYASLSFPNYSSINPVRYLDVDDNGMEYNGWQDFGLTGEILTHPWPWMTYTYQMYSYYIRTNLQALYVDVTLPTSLESLPQWLTDCQTDGHRILWYSMGQSLPGTIELLCTETLTTTHGNQTMIRAEYEISNNEITEQWIVYLMDVDGVFSAYSVRVNESYDDVLSTTDMIALSYQIKVSETA